MPTALAALATLLTALLLTAAAFTAALILLAGLIPLAALLTALLARYRDPVRAAEELARRTEHPFGARIPLSLAGRKY